MKLLLLLAVFIAAPRMSIAQSWLTTGNSGNTAINFLGTTDIKPIIFKTNSFERGRLLSNGVWRFGTTAVNSALIDTTGILTFAGTGMYRVADNAYVFQNITRPNYGLFFNASAPQYEFRNNLANSIFSVNADNGNIAVTGTLKIGAFTVPNTDGTIGQVLSTNGSGIVSWTSINPGANTSLSNLTPTAVNQSLIPSPTNTKDLGSSANAWKNLFISGNAGIGAPNPLVKLEITGGSNASLTGGGNILSGITSGKNIVIDDNEIMARSNSLASDLFINHDGGNVLLGSGIYGTKLGVNTTAPFATLDIRSIGNTSATSSLNIQNTSKTLLLVRNDGRVGINTNAPSVALDVLGDAQFNTGNTTDCDLRLKTTNSDMGWFASGSANKMGLYNYATKKTLMKILGTGEVSFGGDPVSNTELSLNASTGDINNLFNDLRIYTNQKYWEISAYIYEDVTNDLMLYTKDGPAGWFDYNTHLYVPALSPLKSSSEKTSSVLESVNKLQPKMISNPLTPEEHNSYGFDVNDLMKIFPNTVLTSKNAATGEIIYGINYDEFSVIAIKAIQEQQQQLEDIKLQNGHLQTTINNLQNNNSALEERISKLEAMINVQQLNPVTIQRQIPNTKQSNTALEQNIPNPFNHSTTINYSLPQQYLSAKIIVVDKTGKTLKEVNISGSGKGSIKIDAPTLASGAYNYSLYVDGKLIDTKQMVIANQFLP